MKIREKYENLLIVNKELKKRLNALNTKLTISEEKLSLNELAFQLSLKLIQHLKTENQLLRSSQDLTNPFAHPLNALVVETLDNTIVINNTNDLNDDHFIAADNNTTNTQLSIVANSPSADNCGSDLCKSDLIAVEYENEIKELREEYQLLSRLAIDEVLITHEDQLNAKSHLSDSEDSSDECPPQPMDVDVEVSVKAPKDEQKCKYCGKRFTEEQLLVSHKALHQTSDGQQIRCAEDMCGHQFNTKHELKGHLKSVHFNRTKERPKWLSLDNSLRTFECKQCNKELSSMQALRQHQKVIHNMISWFKCKFSGCDQKFEKSTELRAHEEQHRKEHTVIDFKHTLNKSSVNDHSSSQLSNSSKSAVPEEPKFKCTYAGCKASYKHKMSLKKHEQSSHCNTIVDTGAATGNGLPVQTFAGTDMKSRLQLLDLFYATQKRQTEL